MPFTISYQDEPLQVIYIPNDHKCVIHLFDIGLIHKNIDQQYINDIPVIRGGALFTNNVFPISIPIQNIPNDFRIWFGEYAVYCGMFFTLYNLYDSNLQLQHITLDRTKMYMILHKDM